MYQYATFSSRCGLSKVKKSKEVENKYVILLHICINKEYKASPRKKLGLSCLRFNHSDAYCSQVKKSNSTRSCIITSVRTQKNCTKT